MGKTFKKDQAAINEYFENLTEEKKVELMNYFQENENKVIEINTNQFTITKEMLKFKEEERIIQEEKFYPWVIEPAFGLGRII